MSRPTVLPPAGAGPTTRLLNLRQAAAYLGVSFWSVRDYVLAGHLPTVSLPALRPREGDRAKATLRRVLIDREDLDAFIARYKAAAPDVQSRAPEKQAAGIGDSERLCPQRARTAEAVNMRERTR